jgi:hypothetical protein
MKAVRRPAPELRGYLAAFDPAIGRLFLAARAAVLEAAPDANELVYDAYNAVSVAFTFTDRLAGAFCHVAAYTSYVNLGFNHGAELPDPAKLLRGTGTRIRHVRVSSAEDLRSPALRALLRAAVAQGRALAPERKGRGVARVRPTTGAKRRPASAKRRPARR